MLRFTLAALSLGWLLMLAIAFGWVSQESTLGFGPLALLGTAATTGFIEAIEDAERRVLFLLIGATAFVSCLIYAVLRYLMLFGWAGH